MFRLYDKNMKLIPFPDGVKPLDIFISKIERERITDSVEGSDRNEDYGSTYKPRNIELDMWLKSHDTQDYRLQRDELYANLDDVCYVVEDYQKGKRYSVRIDNEFIPDRLPNNQRHAQAKLSCSTVGLPFAESIGTTALIDKHGLTYNEELWSYGMGLLYEEESHVYTHDTTSFKIYNAGNVLIHPFQQDLKIELSGIVGSGFEMKNVTTGDLFKVNDELKANDTFIIDGAQMIYNDVINGFRKTNHGFITLAPGWNEFKLNKPAKTVFDFPFYYK